ncbi:MAG: hypothetical protein ABWY45_23510 [Mycobacterium sp.]
MVSQETIPKLARALCTAAVAAACLVACSDVVEGTPQAEPGLQVPETDTPTTTRSRPPSTSAPSTPRPPTVPPVPTRTNAPAPPGTPADADTTCDEYVNLDEDAQRAVISAIGEENDLISLNPELWITLTSALCTFAEPSTTVREVLEGQGIR